MEQSIHGVLEGLASQVPGGIAVCSNTVSKHTRTLVGEKCEMSIADTGQLDDYKLGEVHYLLLH